MSGGADTDRQCGTCCGWQTCCHFLVTSRNVDSSTFQHQGESRTQTPSLHTHTHTHKHIHTHTSRHTYKQTQSQKHRETTTDTHKQTVTDTQRNAYKQTWSVVHLSIGRDPFVQVSTTSAVTCLETVHQRPCMTREIVTWLSDSRVGNNSVVDHRSQRPVLCLSVSAVIDCVLSDRLRRFSQ